MPLYYCDEENLILTATIAWRNLGTTGIPYYLIFFKTCFHKTSLSIKYRRYTTKILPLGRKYTNQSTNQSIHQSINLSISINFIHQTNGTDT